MSGPWDLLFAICELDIQICSNHLRLFRFVGFQVALEICRLSNEHSVPSNQFRLSAILLRWQHLPLAPKQKCLLVEAAERYYRKVAMRNQAWKYVHHKYAIWTGGLRSTNLFGGAKLQTSSAMCAIFSYLLCCALECRYLCIDTRARPRKCQDVCHLWMKRRYYLVNLGVPLSLLSGQSVHMYLSASFRPECSFMYLSASFRPECSSLSKSAPTRSPTTSANSTGCNHSPRWYISKSWSKV